MTVVSVGTDLGVLQDEMRSQYVEALNSLDDGAYEKSSTACLEYSAVIATNGDWHEWEITAHTLEFDAQVSFTLPDGTVIAASPNGDIANELRGTWISVDITATRPDGVTDNLCAVDWEAGRGTNALVFAPGVEDPVYTHSYGEFGEEV
jgi:hypothetical protein